MAEGCGRGARALCVWGGTAVSVLLICLLGVVFFILQVVSDAVDWAAVRLCKHSG